MAGTIDEILDTLTRVLGHSTPSPDDLLHRIVQAFPQPFACFDAEDRLLLWNSSYAAMNGVAVAAGTSFADIVRRAAMAGIYDLGDESVDGFVARGMELRRLPESVLEVRLSDGRWLQSHERRMTGGGTVVVWTDVSAIRAVSAEHQARQEVLAAALDSMSDGISVLDRDLRLIAWNARYATINGCAAGALSPGMELEALCGAGTGRPLAEIRRSVARVRRGRPFRVLRPGTDGGVIEMRGTPTPSGGFVVTCVDVTLQEREVARVRHLATHDPLTGFANRTLFREALVTAVRDAARRGTLVGVLVVDFDHFRDIDDAVGQGAGDRLLRRVARRFAGLLGPQDTLARLDGDEFALVIRSARSRGDLAELMERLDHAVAKPFRIDGQEVQIGVRIGACLHPFDAGDPDLLLRYAEIALARVKQEGRGHWRFFEPTMAQALQTRRDTVRDLRSALRLGQLHLAYQPQFDARTLRPHGMEALVRWTHPERGVVSPADFVPLAEEAGLIGGIDAFVMIEACRAMRALVDGGYDTGPMGVNVSACRLHEDSFVDDVVRLLAEFRLEPRHLVVEVTETAMMADVAVAIERLSALNRMGIDVAIDDFGAGYSSFSYLQRLPATKLKIDRSFSSTIDRDPRCDSIVGAIVDVGHGLGMRVIAEGVETEMQASRLVRRGCDSLQGFLLGQPMDVAGIAALHTR